MTVTMTMTSRLPALVLALTVTACASAQRPAAESPIGTGSGAFITRLGTDTLAIERFRYTPSSIDVVAAVRVPTTRLLRYHGEVDGRGYLESLTVREFDPMNPPPAGGEPLSRTRFEFEQEGVRITGMNERGAYDFEVETGPEALPFIELIHWPFELALVRQRAETGGTEFPMIAGRQAMSFGLTPLADGRVRIRHPFRGTMDVEVDEQGRIQMLDAANTTRKLTVERVEELDVAAAARDFARRDAAGRGLGVLSGRAESTGTIGGVSISVDYGVPSKRGREIFGALVPYGEVWRTGANRATHLRTDRGLLIGDARVPAGTYTLFTVPGPDAWTLIVNRATDIGGTTHDPELDLAHIPMDVRALDETVEDFTIVVDSTGYLRMRWDRTEAYVPVRAAF